MSIREHLWKQIKSRCAQNPNRKTKLNFIGHSLGGALATLASLDFIVNTDQASSTGYQVWEKIIEVWVRVYKPGPNF